MKRYRLNEYLISYSADGRLWWNSHAGFGMEIGGPCYICGNILLIGARCTEENGFLVSEFGDYLKKFPLWEITPYYCLSENLLDAATSSRLSAGKLHQLLSSHHIIDTGSVSTEKDETFQLGRYQISISISGDITWMSFGGPRQILGGSALVESDVLFLCPKTFNTSNKNKSEFLQTLGALPQWDRTTFYSRTLALKSTSHLKKRISVQNHDGLGVQTAGIRQYVEDFNPESNKDIGPKDFFEMACTNPIVKSGSIWSNECSILNKQRYTWQLLAGINSQSAKWFKKLKTVVNRKVKNQRL